MTEEQIIEAIKQKEKEGADMGAFFDKLVSDGVTTYEDLPDLIGNGSEAYPKGFPGYYEATPNYSTFKLSEISAKEHGIGLPTVYF